MQETRTWSWTIGCTVWYQKRLGCNSRVQGEVWARNCHYKRPEGETMRHYATPSSSLYMWRTCLIPPKCQLGGLPLSAVHTCFHNTLTAMLSVEDAPSMLYLALLDASHRMKLLDDSHPMKLLDGSHQIKFISQGMSSTSWNLCAVRNGAARHTNSFSGAVSLNKLTARNYE